MRFSYIDPGTGSMLISATIALISVGFFMIKGFIYRKFNFKGDKGQFIDPNHHYGLVFYSEGKQYWNVFKPILLECSQRGMTFTFLTSDKDDPALDSNIEGMEALFIGSGREGYFVLNRLHADMVVMTTPGLDVLEIKRSKHVSHYSHLTHAPGCVSGYKSYALDYFDSVLIGGKGDVEIIAYLETLRNLPKKHVEVIGHTYVDGYRECLQSQQYDYTFFEVRRPTILVSPTWSNHGLLMKYGVQLLTQLELAGDFNVIIRPHPQSLISEKEMIDDLMKRFPDNESRLWNLDLENLKAMSHADIMISDFSGIVFDYFMLFNRPILTMRSQYEKRGRDSIDLLEDPWDIQTLAKLGGSLDEKSIPNIASIVHETLQKFSDNQAVSTETVELFNMYPGLSGRLGTDYIESTLLEIQLNPLNRPIQIENGTSEISTFTGEMSEVSTSFFKNMKSSLFNPALFIQLSMGTALMMTYIILALNLLPNEGLNREFFTKLLPYTAYLFVGLLICGVILSRFKPIQWMKLPEKIQVSDLLLILIPLTPVLIYVVSNQDILTMSSSLYVIGYFGIISIGLLTVVPWLFSSIIAKSITVSLTLAFLYTLFNMASYGRVTSMKTIAIVFILISVGAFSLQFLKQKSFLIIVSLLLFIGNGTVSYLDVQAKAKADKDTLNEDEQVIPEGAPSLIEIMTKGKVIQKTPDVYVLIYDSYVNQETMSMYGYDNQAQMDYLMNDGFTIYDGTYSIGASSLISMSQMFNPQTMNLDNHTLRYNLAGGSSSFKSFKSNGYHMVSIQDSDYMTRGLTPQYDFSFPDDKDSINPHTIIIDAILEGEFRFDAEFSNTNYDDYIYAKDQVIGKKSKKPVFLYTHSSYPSHSQNSGVLRPDETEIHIERLMVANEEMKQDIETIRSLNRDAVIIVAGDHGPYLTKNGISLKDYHLSEINRLDIQDRYGTFLAISWPEKDVSKRYDINVLQDVLPAVVAYVYDDVSLFDSLKMEHSTLGNATIGGAQVVDGVIVGGMDDGKPLFLQVGRRQK